MRLLHPKISTGCLLAAVVFVAEGCGFYSFSGSLPSHLKTVAIPQFDNRTAEFGIAEQMTDQVISEFTRDNSLKIADPADADVLVEGSIVRTEDRAGAFDENESVQDLKVYITVAFKVTDQVEHKTIWEERMTQWGSYDPGQGAQARQDGITEALKKIGQEVLNKTVASW
jgi:hypothetical protein